MRAFFPCFLTQPTPEREKASTSSSCIRYFSRPLAKRFSTYSLTASLPKSSTCSAPYLFRTTDKGERTHPNRRPTGASHGVSRIRSRFHRGGNWDRRRPFLPFYQPHHLH